MQNYSAYFKRFIKKTNPNKITFDFEDNNDNEVNFNGETIKFTFPIAKKMIFLLLNEFPKN